MPTKCRPPSVVRTIEVHTGFEHGALPRSQNSWSEMAVNEIGSKPEGTGPPAAWAPGPDVVVVAGGVVFVVVVGVVAPVLGVLVDAAALPVPEEPVEAEFELPQPARPASSARAAI
jgi:hypothetical protein